MDISDIGASSAQKVYEKQKRQPVSAAHVRNQKGDSITISDEAIRMFQSMKNNTVNESGCEALQNDSVRTYDDVSSKNKSLVSTDDSEKRLGVYASTIVLGFPSFEAEYNSLPTLQEGAWLMEGKISQADYESLLAKKGISDKRLEKTHFAKMYDIYNDLLKEVDENAGGKANLNEFTEEELKLLSDEFLRRINEDKELSSKVKKFERSE